jgi:hypothetical protein
MKSLSEQTCSYSQEAQSHDRDRVCEVSIVVEYIRELIGTKGLLSLQFLKNDDACMFAHSKRGLLGPVDSGGRRQAPSACRIGQDSRHSR